MAKDLGDAIGTALGQVAREAVQTISSNTRGRSNGALSGTKGIAAGAGLAALAPLAAKGAGKLVRGMSANGAGPVRAVGDKLGDSVKSVVSEKAGQAKGAPGVGKGRRMPVQQDIDIGVPLKT